jgi:GPI transamidase subunit PIG-U
MATNSSSANCGVTFCSARLTWVATAVRILISAGLALPPDLTAWIQSPVFRSVLIDPVQTISHVTEAAAIRELSLPGAAFFPDAYNGNKIHIPPLQLAAFEALMHWSVILAIIVVLADFWIASNLERLARSLLTRDDTDTTEAEGMERMDERIRPDLSHIFPFSSKTSASLLQWNDLPGFIAQFYYCSPIIVLASATTDCVQSIKVGLLLEALSESAATGNRQQHRSIVWASFALSLAVYMDLHYIVFLIPVAILWSGSDNSHGMGVLFDLFTVVLQGLSFLLVGKGRYLTVAQSTHFYTFNLVQLQPSLNILWYFGMQIFRRFHSYFTFIMAGLPYLLIIPTAIRFHQYPAVLVSKTSPVSLSSCNYFSDSHAKAVSLFLSTDCNFLVSGDYVSTSWNVVQS